MGEAEHAGEQADEQLRSGRVKQVTTKARASGGGDGGKWKTGHRGDVGHGGDRAGDGRVGSSFGQLLLSNDGRHICQEGQKEGRLRVRQQADLYNERETGSPLDGLPLKLHAQICGARGHERPQSTVS